jgi:hypothetical protein
MLLDEMAPDLVMRAGHGPTVKAGEAEAGSPKRSCVQLFINAENNSSPGGGLNFQTDLLPGF